MNGEQLIAPNGGHKHKYDFIMNNHIYAEFDVDFRSTMLGIKSDYRHKGLIVTYIEGDTINIYMYNTSLIDDSSFGTESNWKKLNW